MTFGRIMISKILETIILPCKGLKSNLGLCDVLNQNNDNNNIQKVFAKKIDVVVELVAEW